MHPRLIPPQRKRTGRIAPRTLWIAIAFALTFGSSAYSFASNETTLILRFQSGVVSFPGLDEGRGSYFTASLQDARVGFEPLRTGLASLGVRRFRTSAPSFRHLPTPQYDRFGVEIEQTDLKDTYYVSFRCECDDGDLVENIKSLPGIAHVEKAPSLRFFYTPNDEFFDDQWNLHNPGGDFDILESDDCLEPTTDCSLDIDIDAPAAWELQRQPGGKIGVLDTGIYANHDDLDGSTAYGSDTQDPCKGHGTAVSGIIAGAGNNYFGIAGAARPNHSEAEEILVVRSCIESPNPCAPDPELVEINLADFTEDEQLDVRVVNESWGSPHYRFDYNTVQRDVHRNAYLEGLTVVAASGVPACFDPARTDSCVVFPAAFDHMVLASPGIDCHGEPVSSTGSWLDVAAPGGPIVTTDWSGGEAYQGKDQIEGNCGSSLAAPHVAGAAGLLLGADPSLGPDDVFAILKRTAMDLGDQGPDYVSGYGLLKMAAALELVTDPNEVRSGTTSQFSWSLIDSRQQRFRRVPGVNGDNEDWRTCYVRVYQLDIWAPFSLEVGESIVDAWARPRLSTGFPDEAVIDRNLFGGFLGVVSSSITNQGCYLRTYTYKIYADPGYSTCLTWYPVAIPQEGICGGSAQIPRFNYAFVVTGALPLAGPSPGANALRARMRDGTLVIQTQEMTGQAEVEVFDAGGRMLWGRRFEASQDERSFVWPGAEPSGVMSGVYFVRLKIDGKSVGSRRICVVR